MKEAADSRVHHKGAAFRKCDLHVHTPASKDMHQRWREGSPEELVQHALAKGLDVIAVTDHNSVDWCDRVRQAASATRLTVLPGIEISTAEGHLLAIFDPAKETSEVKEFLIQIGLREKDVGNLEAIAKGGLDEVAQAVEREGGIALAAHVDRERGFSKMVKTGARRKEIRSCRELRGFEIADSSLRAQYSKTAGRQVACLQGSDSWPVGGDRHHLDAVGTRFCFVKMDEVSVWAIRQATFDPGLRIKLAEDSLTTPGLAIEGMWTSGGFLSGQRFRFSDEISCLIGDTGSGKSLTIELIRFALDQQVGEVLPAIREEVKTLLGFALRDMDTVYVLIRKGSEQYVVERPWLGDAPPPPTVHRVIDGQSELITESIHLPSFFPVKGYSQSEIIEYAREPLARLSLIDSLIDTTSEQEEVATAKAQLRRNAADLVAAGRELRRDESRLQELPGLTEEITALSRFLEHPQVKQQEVWHQEGAIFRSFEEALDDLAERGRAEFPGPPPFPSEAETPEEPLNRDLLERLVALATEVEATLDKGKENLLTGVKRLREQYAEVRAAWGTRFEQAEKQYKELAAQLNEAAHGQAAVLTKLSQLRQTEQGLKNLHRRLEKQVRPRLTELQTKREELLTQLQEARKALTTKRRKKADQLTSRLSGMVSIEVQHARDNRDFKRKLMDIRTGSRLQENEIEAIADKAHPVPLVKSLIQGDFEQPARVADLPSAVFQRLMETITAREKLEELFELQLVDLEDLVQVRFAVAANTYKDLEALAHGQKCTVVLMISLAEGDFPLLVDQPEDALHAPWIEDYIVAALRNRRGTRQCIFATRSANVLVSADADQVIALKADATRGQIERTGALDRFDTRDLVLFHVEGGKDAFKRRQDKYGLEYPA